MSIESHGIRHQWFAWHPVETQQQGWRWLRKVTRYKVYLDMPGAPTFWAYELPTQGDTMTRLREP